MENLRNAIKNVQDEKRFEHTLGVAYTAACLANLYGVDVNKALRAGLLHDCAKCIPSEETLSLCEKYDIEMSEIEKRNPFLLHAKLGAKLAEVIYKETDEDVLCAIKNHTTGRPEMSTLEKIVFVADYMEPGRDKAPNLYDVRRLSYNDLDKALVRILQDTLVYLARKGEEVDPGTQQTLDYYIGKQ